MLNIFIFMHLINLDFLVIKRLFSSSCKMSLVATDVIQVFNDIAKLQLIQMRSEQTWSLFLLLHLAGEGWISRSLILIDQPRSGD